MITAASSGGCGDLVYAIPVMKKLGVTRVYVKENWYKPPFHSLYSVMKDLLEMQGFEVLPTAGGCDPMHYEQGLHVDYDMDKFRLMPKRGRYHIMVNMMRYFGVTNNDWQKPWLEIKGKMADKEECYNLVHVTSRWREGSRVNWKSILPTIPKPVYFIGFDNEWMDFTSAYGHIPYAPVSNILEMARLIRDCQTLYCNQSVALTIAQGLGKKYFLEVKPGKTNTLMHTPNENILK